jgi:hypothetical protein
MSTKSTLLALAAAALLLAGARTGADDKKAQFTDAPGPMHQQLAKRVGDYTTTTRFTPKPGAEARESTGSAHITTVLDGRFLSEETKGEQFGMPYAALKLYGYNNGAERYEATWMYTGSTAIMTLTGASKDEGKTVEYSATFALPKGATMNLTVTVRQIDEDKFVTELATKEADGKKGPTLETTYTRKK